MATTSFQLRIVTPERLLLDEQVEEVVAPGASGEFGVLPDHITFLTTLAPGRLIYRIGSQRRVVAIFGGYAEVVDNVMTVLADGAESADQINAESAKSSCRELAERLAAVDVTAPDVATIRRALDREIARIAAADERV